MDSEIKQPMRQLLFKIIRYSGLPYLFREIVQRRRVTIVMMHDISLPAASQAFRFWKYHYNPISMQDFLRARDGESGYKLPPKPIVITMDDGHKENYKLTSLVKELEIPIAIFLCADIVGTNRHFWFKHEGCNPDNLKMVPDQKRIEKLSELGFSKTKEYPDRQALTDDEVIEMKKSPLINFQNHTRFHPILTKCTDNKVYDEINSSKKTLEKRYSINVAGFAYPNGDYGNREVEVIKKAGHQYALTTTPGFNSLQTNLFELKRLSVNDSENLDEIVVKSSGVWGIMKHVIGINFQKE